MNHSHAALLRLLGGRYFNLLLEPRLNMLRWILLLILFLSSLHIAVTRFSMLKFVCAERLALYLLDILFRY